MDKRPPDLSPTSQYLCTGWSFCLGEAGSRLITTSTPHSQPMDAEVRLTSIDFNLREARKNGTGLLGQYHFYWKLCFRNMDF